MFSNGLAVLSSLLLASAAAAAQHIPQLSRAGAPLATVPQAAVVAEYGKLPLSFEANQGQVDSRVRFTSRGNGYALFLMDKEAVLALSTGGAKRPVSPTVGAASPKSDVVRLQLAGGAAGLKVSGGEQLPGTANYFIGNDSSKWHSNVPTYAKVKYTGVYPGVDLVYYGSQRQLEYDFVVAPGADAGQVRLRFAGAERLKLNSDGDLMVVAKHGEIAFHKPVLYQMAGDQRKGVEGKFTLLAGNVVGFSVGSYDKGRELVIDPVLEYSTYLGGAGSDYAAGMAVDLSGNAYVTGYTYSTNFPTTTGAYQTTNAYTTNTKKSAVFITKLNANGTGLVYSTYLEGTAHHCKSLNYNALVLGDFGSAIAVDSSGNAFVTGELAPTIFPQPLGLSREQVRVQRGRPSMHSWRN